MNIEILKGKAIVKSIFFLILIVIADCSFASSATERKKFSNFMRPFYEACSVMYCRMHKEYENLPTMPEEIRPEKILTPDSVYPIFQSAYETAYSDEEIKTLNSFFSSDVGEKFIHFLSSRVYEEDFFDHTPDQKKESDDLRLALIDNKETVDIFFSKSKLEVSKYIVDAEFKLSQSRISSYYKKSSTFSLSDSTLCMEATDKILPLYAIYVCDEGMRRHDFQSTMMVAKQYYSGMFSLVRSRDIKRAKSILKSILSRDSDGEAHYILGMLIKNAQSKDETNHESWCYLKKAEKLGKEIPASTYKMFAASDMIEECSEK